jgi:hypothetical protein
MLQKKARWSRENSEHTGNRLAGRCARLPGQFGPRGREEGVGWHKLGRAAEGAGLAGLIS